MWREQMRLNAADTPVKRESTELCKQAADFVSDLPSFPLIKAATFMLQF